MVNQHAFRSIQLKKSVLPVVLPPASFPEFSFRVNHVEPIELSFFVGVNAESPFIGLLPAAAEGLPSGIDKQAVPCRDFRVRRRRQKGKKLQTIMPYACRNGTGRNQSSKGRHNLIHEPSACCPVRKGDVPKAEPPFSFQAEKVHFTGNVKKNSPFAFSVITLHSRS